MAKTTHTHTGTCQACGAVQAVDNASRLIAKHGYKVAGFGFFNGTCQGSGHKPAEFDITLTHAIMVSCEQWAVEADRLAGLWRDGSLMVLTHESPTGKRDAYSRRTYHSVMMFGCSEYDIGRERGRLEYMQESQAKNARAHAEGLLTHVIPRFGRELYPVKPKAARREFKAGETVTLHGREFVITVPEMQGFKAKYAKGHFNNDPTIRTVSLRALRMQNT